MSQTLYISGHTEQREYDVARLFSYLTDEGMQPGSLLYESEDENGKFTGLSIGVFLPSLKVSGKDASFTIEALDDLGAFLLPAISENLPEMVTDLQQTEIKLSGQLIADTNQVASQQRLQSINHTHILRALLMNIQGDKEYKRLPNGLFGGFAYDFIRQFESIEKMSNDEINDDDYCFYLAKNVFVVDHHNKQTHFISLNNTEIAAKQDVKNILLLLKQYAAHQIPTNQSIQLGEFVSDISEQEFLDNVIKLKQHIKAGDIFQVQHGRLVSADFSGNSFQVYRTLKARNASPYMFYMRDEAGALLGCSPELCIGVSQLDNGEHKVELTPIAGTKPRGFVDGKANQELDQRYALALQTDHKEMAEHVMLIDLCRNDIASISKPNTKSVTESMLVKKYQYVQHLVSRVQGILMDDIDALTAYVATMNMGTLTGAPKLRAMQLIAEYEKNERGYYGGGFGFITHDGEMDMAIIIRAMRIKNDRVYLRASAGIVADSIPDSEYQETVNKMRSCITALQEAAQ